MRTTLLTLLLLLGVGLRAQTIEDAQKIKQAAVARSIIALYGGPNAPETAANGLPASWDNKTKRRTFRTLGKELESFGMGISYRNIGIHEHALSLDIFMDNFHISVLGGFSDTKTFLGGNLGLGITRRIFAFGGGYAQYTEQSPFVSTAAGQRLEDTLVERISSFVGEFGLTAILPVGKVHLQPKISYNTQGLPGLGVGIVF